MSDLAVASLEKYGHTWHQMFLLRPGVIKQQQKQTQTHSPPSSQSNPNTVNPLYLVFPYI